MIKPWFFQLSTLTTPGRIQTSPGVEEVGNSPTAPWFDGTATDKKRAEKWGELYLYPLVIQHIYMENPPMLNG